MVEIICQNTSSKVLVPLGSKLIEIRKYINIEEKECFVGAFVNNVLESLNHRIYTPQTIKFIDITHPCGRRVYAMSLIFVLYKAVKEIYKTDKLHLHYSMTNGYYAHIDDNSLNLKENYVETIKEKMQEIIDKAEEFHIKSLPIDEAVELFNKLNLNVKANLAKMTNRLYASVAYCGETINYFYSPLLYDTSYLKVFDLIPFDKGFLLIMPDKKDVRRTPKTNPNQKKLFNVFEEYQNWVEILHTPHLCELNEALKQKGEESLIQISEALHEKKYATIADNINQNKKGNIKIVLLAGPSSSGKTTSCRRLSTQLSVLGKDVIELSLDDYFLDREHSPKDENGSYDFESINAIDLDLFNSQMNDLLNGKDVFLPHYNFIKGVKEFSSKPTIAKDNSILIIEGIHGLNPKLTNSIPKERVYKVFVSALIQLSIDNHNLISSSDNRLIRRIVRDYNYRGYSAQDTLSRWNSVREGEEKNIFPFQEEADEIFNSSLLYEIGALKPLASSLLREVGQNTESYSEAKRLLAFLDNFTTIDPKFIPPTSILREFLGGSSFQY